VPSTETGTEGEQPVEIADLFSKCSALEVRGERERERIVGTITPMLAWLGEPVVLRPGSLGDAFGGFTGVTLETGATVVMTDSHGKVSSMPLQKFRTEECLAIIQVAFPELQRMVADRRRGVRVRPALSMKLFLGGQRFILDMRSYRLLVSNSGGDCRDLRVSAELPNGKNRDYGERDLSRGGRIEVDLGLLKELQGAENLKLRIECKDVDGREFCGDVSLPLRGDRAREATLGPKTPRP
jgi:hypothetical protein